MPRSDLVHPQRPPQWQGLFPWLQSGHLHAASAHYKNVLCFTFIPCALFGVVLKIKDGFTFHTVRSFPYICVCMPICMHCLHMCVCVYKCNKKLGVPYFSAQFTMFVDYCFFFFLLLSMSTNILPNCTKFHSADMQFYVTLTFVLLTF